MLNYNIIPVKSMLLLVATMIMILTSVAPVDASRVRIKDICSFQNKVEYDLIGYGLVIGLDGTGDGNATQFTTQSLVNMMERMGLTVDPKKVKVKNVAAVMVTAKTSSHQFEGSHIDVTVSSVGDASSLQGGTLLLTPLSGPDGYVYVTAQGAVSIGGFNVSVDDNNKIVNNYTLVGRVPGGGKVVKHLDAPKEYENELYLSLINPDYTTSHRIAQKINSKFGLTAFPVDAGTVRVLVPDSLSHPVSRMKFVSDVGLMRIIPDNPARVVINEKTGTIVAGENVTIDPVAIAHGTITVNIQSTPIISQPDPFSGGETVVTQETFLSVNQENARVTHMKGAVNLADIAKALNKIGATPRDIIAIFQALKQAGALRAELVIL